MIGKDPTVSQIKNAKGYPSKFVIGMGSAEVGTDSANKEMNNQYVDWAKEVDAMLSRQARLSKSDHKLLIGDGHVHNETAWAARFGEAIQFLFPAN